METDQPESLGPQMGIDEFFPMDIAVENSEQGNQTVFSGTGEGFFEVLQSRKSIDLKLVLISVKVFLFLPSRTSCVSRSYVLPYVLCVDIEP